jgi:malate dehydrogenase (oxaloacetate-decarboxylating)
MALHPYYRGKIEESVKCTVRDFAIWYTPGVAAPRRTVAQDPDKVYDHTSVMNAEFIAQPPN